MAAKAIPETLMVPASESLRPPGVAPDPAESVPTIPPPALAADVARPASMPPEPSRGLDPIVPAADPTPPPKAVVKAAANTPPAATVPAAAEAHETPVVAPVTVDVVAASAPLAGELATAAVTSLGASPEASVVVAEGIAFQREAAAKKALAEAASDDSEREPRDSRRATTDPPSPTTQRRRRTSSRSRAPYADSQDADLGDAISVLPRPMPKVLVRVMLIAAVVTLAVGGILVLRHAPATPVRDASHDSVRILPPVVSPPVAPVPSATTEPPPSAVPVEAAIPAAEASAAAPAPAASAVPSAVAVASSQPAPVPSDSPSPRTLVAQAEALLGRGSYAHAIEVAKRATAADPANPEGWLTLGGAYGAQGNTSQARAAYHKCVDLAKGGGVRECKALLAQ